MAHFQVQFLCWLAVLSRQPGLKDAEIVLWKGDTLAVWKLDRLGQSIQHLIESLYPHEADIEAENEGARFWLNVLTELQNRGVKDILIACVDGLKGFPDAINTVYPNTRIQLWLVHMVRNSVKFVPWKDYKPVTTDLKQRG